MAGKKKKNIPPPHTDPAGQAAWLARKIRTRAGLFKPDPRPMLFLRGEPAARASADSLVYRFKSAEGILSWPLDLAGELENGSDKRPAVLRGQEDDAVLLEIPSSPTRPGPIERAWFRPDRRDDADGLLEALEEKASASGPFSPALGRLMTALTGQFLPGGLGPEENDPDGAGDSGESLTWVPAGEGFQNGGSFVVEWALKRQREGRNVLIVSDSGRVLDQVMTLLASLPVETRSLMRFGWSGVRPGGRDCSWAGVLSRRLDEHHRELASLRAGLIDLEKKEQECRDDLARLDEMERLKLEYQTVRGAAEARVLKWEKKQVAIDRLEEEWRRRGRAVKKAEKSWFNRDEKRRRALEAYREILAELRRTEEAFGRERQELEALEEGLGGMADRLSDVEEVASRRPSRSQIASLLERLAAEKSELAGKIDALEAEPPDSSDIDPAEALPRPGIFLTSYNNLLDHEVLKPLSFDAAAVLSAHGFSPEQTLRVSLKTEGEILLSGDFETFTRGGVKIGPPPLEAKSGSPVEELLESGEAPGVGASLFFLDLGPREAWCGREFGGLSRFNFSSAEAALEASLTALDGVQADEPEAEPPVLILTPSEAQAGLIARMLFDAGLEISVRCRVSGSGSNLRARVVIFDSVADEPHVSSLLSRPGRFEEARAVLEEALSAASEKFIFIGSSNWLAERAGPKGALGAFFSCFKKRAAPWKQKPPSQRRGEGNEVLTYLGPDDFLKALRRDIGKARNSILFFCPDSDSGPWAGLEPLCQASLDRGLKTIVFAPPPSQTRDSKFTDQAIRKLRLRGALVNFVSGIRGREIIIDDRVIYFRGPDWSAGEGTCIRRFEGPLAGARALELLQLDLIEKATTTAAGNLRSCPYCGWPIQVVNQLRQHGPWDYQPLKVGCLNDDCRKFLRNIDERRPLTAPPVCPKDERTRYVKVRRGRGAAWQCPAHPEECLRIKWVPGDPD